MTTEPARQDHATYSQQEGIPMPESVEHADTSTSPLADLTADVAAWLSDHAHHDLPRINGVQVHHWAASGTEALLQLTTATTSLSDLAAWAEHLGTAVEFQPSQGQFSLRAAIHTTLSRAHPIVLWNYLDAIDRQTLEATLGHPIDDRCDITPAVLRQAATAPTAPESTTPGGESA
jgi:hypothetical protein